MVFLACAGCEIVPGFVGECHADLVGHGSPLLNVNVLPSYHRTGIGDCAALRILVKVY